MKILASFCRRLPVPRRYRELAVSVARHHGIVHRKHELRPRTVGRLIEAVDAVRRPERFEEFLLACEADARGRAGLENQPYPQANSLRAALNAARNVQIEDLQGTAKGAELGEQLKERRIQAIREVLLKISADRRP